MTVDEGSFKILLAAASFKVIFLMFLSRPPMRNVWFSSLKNSATHVVEAACNRAVIHYVSVWHQCVIMSRFLTPGWHHYVPATFSLIQFAILSTWRNLLSFCRLLPGRSKEWAWSAQTRPMFSFNFSFLSSQHWQSAGLSISMSWFCQDSLMQDWHAINTQLNPSKVSFNNVAFLALRCVFMTWEWPCTDRDY